MVFMREKFELGEPVFLSNMMVYPILGEGREVEVATLEEESREGRVEIMETGDVNSLDVDYRGGNELLIIQGEEIVGAMQNRIFATSMLLPRGRENVPVYCVEEGRWSGEGNLRPSGYIAFPSVRSIISQGTPETQASVWKEISRKQTTLKIQSKTRAMTESFRQKEEELNYYRDYRPLPEQVGFAVFSNLRFLGLEVFSNPGVFQAFLEKLLLSYGLDALEDRMKEGQERRVKPEEALQALDKTQLKERKNPGVGRLLSGFTRLLVIRKLVKEGVLLHGSVFLK